MTEPKTKKPEAASKLSDKMLMIMECLADSWHPMRLMDISAKLKINQPTVLRYINSLINSNYVYQEKGTQRYALTLKICRLGQQVSSTQGIRTMAAPYLNSLANVLNVSITLVVEKDGHAIYLDIAEKPGAVINTLQHIGRKSPVYATATGKILLSSYSKRELDNFIETVGLEQITPNTITTKDRLLSELDTIRRCGYAYDNEESEPDIRCIAVPLYNYTDTIAAAIGVFDNVENLTDERIENEILPAIHKAQREISLRLGSSLQPSYTIYSEAKQD